MVEAILLVGEVVAIRHLASERLRDLVLIAHELDQVWLEDFNCVRVSVALRDELLLLLLAKSVLCVHAVAIKEEHPLVHVEVLNVKLRHQLYNFHAFYLQQVVTLRALRNIKHIDKFIE